MTKVLSFDIGGTKIAYAMIDEGGNFLNEIIKVSTPKTAAGVVELLKTTAKGLEDKIDGVAISTAGAVDQEGTRITSYTGNLPEGYNQTDFVALSTKPVLVENDANSAGWAEFSLGAAKGCRNAVILTLGTGVGAGIIVRGVRNTEDMAYELKMADFNYARSGVETCLLTSPPELHHLSSTAARAALSAGEEPSGMLPDGVWELLVTQMKKSFP